MLLWILQNTLKPMKTWYIHHKLVFMTKIEGWGGKYRLFQKYMVTFVISHLIKGTNIYPWKKHFTKEGCFPLFLSFPIVLPTTLADESAGSVDFCGRTSSQWACAWSHRALLPLFLNVNITVPWGNNVTNSTCKFCLVCGLLVGVWIG